MQSILELFLLAQRGRLPEARRRLHHLCYEVPSLDAEVERSPASGAILVADPRGGRGVRGAAYRVDLHSGPAADRIFGRPRPDGKGLT